MSAGVQWHREPAPGRILAIDPGSKRSAVVEFSAGEPGNHGIVENDELVDRFLGRGLLLDESIVCEWMAPRGMPTSADELETCYWVGRFVQALSPATVHRLTRHKIKLAICGNARANDVNIRAALIDRFGGKEAAIGLKKTPGPLYGFAGDEWAALAVALAYADGAR